MEKRAIKKRFLPGVFLLLILGIICLLVYKAQLEKNLDQPVEFTMMTEHKATSEIILSEESPEFSEIFSCEMPDLKKISIECTGTGTAAKAVLVMTLADAGTGEIYYQIEKKVSQVLKDRIKKKVVMELPETLGDSEGKELLLTWEIENAGTTELTLTANTKQVIVTSFDGQDGSGTNVIYTLYYGNNGFLRNLYVLLCAALLFFAALSYWLLVIMRLPVQKFYVPLALVLGLIVQGLITVNGVPDEPTHFDTAYKYSNQMLLVPDTGTAGTIYKRECDAVQADCLANGLESNSYYQVVAHTFEKPENTGLVLVSAADSSGLATGLVYLPAAAGISVGRLLGASAMLTMQLARIFNLLFYVLLTWLAIRLVPFGKNVFAMVGMLPIALQQGASASYDAMVNGMIFLFLAVCLNLSESYGKSRKNVSGKKVSGKNGESAKYLSGAGRKFAGIFSKTNGKRLLAIVLAVMIVCVKGGVYVPLLGIGIWAFPWRREKAGNRKKKVLWLCLILAVCVVFVLAVIWKFRPFLEGYMTDSGQEGEDALYTIPYLLGRPLKVLYLYWNTLMESGGQLIQGLLGGRLSWLDFEIDWILLLPFLLGLLLLANVEGDCYHGSRKKTRAILVLCGISVLLIMASMLVGYTTQKWDSIQGIQGRYFLPLAPLVFTVSANSMVKVRAWQCARIWMTMMAVEAVVLLQAAAMVA